MLKFKAVSNSNINLQLKEEMTSLSMILWVILILLTWIDEAQILSEKNQIEILKQRTTN